VKQRADFTENLENLFDIAHENAEQLIVNKEDWEFLEGQRKKVELAA